MSGINMKNAALGLLKVASVKLAISRHPNCRKGGLCEEMEDVRLAALAYSLETLRAVASKRDNANLKPGQASRESVVAVVAELEATLLVLTGERRERSKSDEHGATQQPGVA